MAYVIGNRVNLGSQYDYDDAVKEIADLLNVGPRTDGKLYQSDVCLAENINWQSRCKPIEYPATRALTAAERKGSAQQQAAGIFYGIAIKGNVNQNIDASLADVHNVTFEYIRPTTFKRLRDFDGYSHGAKASPSYTISSEGNWEDPNAEYGGIMGINIYYSTTDLTGVNLVDRLVGVNANDTLKHAFPAIVITKADGTSYMTALFLQGTTTAAPLMDSNGLVDSTRYYQCMMNKPTYNPVSTDISSNSPFNKAEVVTASVILVRSASTTQPLLNTGGSAAANNFGLNWIRLQNGLKTAAFPIVLAGDNGISISLKDIFNGVKFVPDTIAPLSISGQKPSLVIKYKEMTGETSTNQITLTARAVVTKITTNLGTTMSPSGAGNTSTITLNGWNGQGSLVNQISVELNALSLTGYTWIGYVTLTTKDGNKEAQTSSRYEFEFTT